MMEAFAMILCVAFGMVIGAVYQSFHDWRVAEQERREYEAAMAMNWQDGGYRPCVGYPMQDRGGEVK